MAIFTKESLENLRHRIDLIEVLSSHIELKRSGASYKALCPFHDEHTPSFMVQKGDTHYHCFGCGAHGDAIQFLMTHAKMSFLDSVESLAERFHVQLEQVEGSVEEKGPSKADMKEALAQASRFYHFYLLHTAEGHEALKYLYSRGIDLEFIRLFQVGLAPRASGHLRKVLHAKFVKDEIMEAAGLIARSKDGGWRDFFSDRITFPIHDPMGSVIGFSARKYKEETFGGKYINTSETPLFKKSRVLFGLNYSRRKIAKEKKVIVVEGQIDALRLIQEGFDITVAGQGTAFGEGHVRELLNLGVQEVILALDADDAGREAACKIGDFFQKEGVEVQVVQLTNGGDPDSCLKEFGPEGFLSFIETSEDYLTFLVKHRAKFLSLDSPATKNQLIQLISKQIREWSHPLMVHESLRKLAHLTQVAESLVTLGHDVSPNLYIKKSATAGMHVVDPEWILETDFLRWLVLFSDSFPQFITQARSFVTKEHFHVSACRQLYQVYLDCREQNLPRDFLSLAIQLDDGEAQKLLNDLLKKKVNKERAEKEFLETIQKLLDRRWMELREDIKIKIQSGQCSDDEVLDLVRQFNELKRTQVAQEI